MVGHTLGEGLWEAAQLGLGGAVELGFGQVGRQLRLAYPRAADVVVLAPRAT
jgi:hypothetical protein